MMFKLIKYRVNYHKPIEDSLCQFRLRFLKISLEHHLISPLGTYFHWSDSYQHIVTNVSLK